MALRVVVTLLVLSVLPRPAAAQGTVSMIEHARKHGIGNEVSAEAPPKSKPIGGYKKTRWGQAPERVKAALGKVEESENLLVETAPVAGFAARTSYVFHSERGLASVEVVLTAEHAETSRHVSDFAELRRLLTKKYGEPRYETARWKDRSRRTGPEGFAPAIAEGNLSLFVRWELPGTRIALECGQHEGSVRNHLLYESVWHLQEAARRDHGGGTLAAGGLTDEDKLEDL